MYIIGLTGNIASGKSTVSKILRELGAVIIDADIIAREVVEPGKPAWEEIRKVFGDEVLNNNMTINRDILGKKVFGFPEQLNKLNAITHPAIINEMHRQIKFLQEKNHTNIVLDVPLLIETGLYKEVDEVWVVFIPEEIQINRLMERDKISRDQALKKIRSQMRLEEKLKYADVVIDNSKDINFTRQQVKYFWERISLR